MSDCDDLLYLGYLGNLPSLRSQVEYDGLRLLAVLAGHAPSGSVDKAGMFTELKRQVREFERAFASK